MRLLKTKCFSCHNEQKQKGGLVMTSRETLLKGGDDGAVAVPGAPEESALITSLDEEADPHMPPKKQLSPAQIETLQQWVKAGAVWDAAALADPPKTARAITIAPPPGSYRPVLAMALSPDGTRLAAGCGNQLIIYDVTEAKFAAIARASAQSDPVQSVAWSGDGKWLATGAFRRVMIWNPESLAVEREIVEGLTDRITALRFLPDGKQLALADGRVAEEGTVRLLETGTGALGASWKAHADTIFDLAVSSDGQLLATAGGDKLVKVWELATRKEIARLEGHVAQVLTLGFSADASQIVTGGADQQLSVWDLKTRERTMKLGTHTAAITGAVWSPAGPAVFAATDAGGLLRYSELKAATGAQSSESANERKFESADTALLCLAATANGERVFAGSHDGRVFAWNKDGKIVTKREVVEPEPVTAMVAK